MGNESAASRSKKYSAVKTRFFIADLALTVAALLFFQLVVSRPLSEGAYSVSGSFYISSFLYVGVFLAFMYLVSFPLHIAGSFFVERHFELSNQDLRSWAADEIKSVALSFLLWMVSAQVFYLVLRNFPGVWWVMISCLWILFSILLSRILPVLIIPLFYKYSPIKESGLKEKIFRLAEKAKVDLLDVCQIDFSKKTKKANAALVGLGKTRKVILADTLMEEFTPEETLSVVAHEFGHYRYKHIWQLLAFASAITLFGFYLLFLLAGKVAVFADASGISDLYLFPTLLLLMMAFGTVILPLQNFVSRVLEKQADRFTLEITRSSDDFISVMRKLAAMNLADMEPPLWKKIFLYDHPPIAERIKMAKEHGKTKE